MPGADGKSGSDGEDGKSSFVVYSQYANGKNSQGNSSFTSIPSLSTKYMGIAFVASSTAPTDASAYTWSQYIERSIVYDDSKGKPTLIIN